MSINHSANQLLDQLAVVIENLTDEQFSQRIPTLSHSSIGQHVRHTLEFFICLMDAKNEGMINYDSRKHDKFIEEETALAMSVIGSIKSFLDASTQDFGLELHANYETDQHSLEKISTNFFRELAYNIEHAIHHMALIKIGVRELLPDFELPEHFGVASSTIRYQKNQN